MYMYIYMILLKLHGPLCSPMVFLHTYESPWGAIGPYDTSCNVRSQMEIYEAIWDSIEPCGARCGLATSCNV